MLTKNTRGAQTAIDSWNHKFVDPVDMLSKVDIPIHTREECSKLKPGAGGRDTVVCAGGKGKNVCGGDSGGPLIDLATRQVIAVASWVIPDKRKIVCGSAPAVYTRVGSYIPWIEANLGAASSSQAR